MKRLSTNTLFLLTAFLCSGGWQGLFAQEGQPAIERYNFNVIFLSYPAPNEPYVEQPLNLKFFSNKKVYNISTHEGGMSRYFNYKGASLLHFVKENGTNEMGEKIYAPVLQVDMGKSGQKLIFIIRKPNGKFVGTSFDMSLKAFPENTMRVFNFSNQAVKAKVAKRVRSIEPFKSQNFEVEAEQRKILLDFALATAVNNKTKVIEMTRLAFTKNGRRLVLVYNDVRNSEVIRYRAFPIARPVAVDNKSDEELEVEDYEKYERQERLAQ
jgi:hypothetical protein